ncbi:uncharacterized protein LOC21395443 [Morus notabilis]|uniref:uncharacterized protein LOC21395443 n=1 Tax=Morus notabilis TaxID=981085 RepID=UPI000CECEFBD|nr:uncharacterized protein LOC21395443 [Morus notabilis]
MKSGDIVWAKIREEPSGTCYWPGLLQTRDTLGVLVSFFNLQNPRHFHDSEIHPFSGNFLQSAPTNLDGAGNALLDRALRWLCRRTALSLRCRCLSETAVAKMSGGLEMAVGDGEAFRAKNSFRPEAVLGFVLSKAVLPWVEVEGFVGAVRSVAEIQVFRDYNAIGQKSVYQKSRRAWRRCERGTHLELQSHPSSGSMAEESCNLERNFDSQASPKPKEANMEAGAASRMNSTVVFSKESFQPLHEDQLEKHLIQVQKEERQSSSEILVNLRCLALDSFCLGVSCLNNTQQHLLGFRSILFENVSVRHIKKCSPSKSREAYLSSPGYLKTQPSVEASEILVNLRCLALDSFFLGVSCLDNTQQHLLGFRSILFEKVSDRHIKKCCPSKSREAYLSSPGYLKTQLSVEADEKKCDDGVCGSIIPYIERPVSRLGLKRRLDLPAFCESPYKLNKRTPFLLINGAGYCLQMNRPPEAEVERSGTGSEETSIHNFSLGSSKMLEIQNSRALILNHASNTGLLEFSPNTSDFSLLKHSARLSNIIDISKDEEHKVKDACGSYVELQELDRSISIVKNDRSCMYNICNTSEKTINGFANEDMKVDNSFGLLQPSATQLSISEMPGTNASDVEKANHDAATEVSRSEFRPILDSTQMQTSGDKDAISVGPNKRAVSLNVASKKKLRRPRSSIVLVLLVCYLIHTKQNNQKHFPGLMVRNLCI